MSEVTTEPRTRVAGRGPQAVFEPQSLDELADLLRREDGLTLVPRGGGTMLELGNAPRAPFGLVDLRAAIPPRIEHEASDLTLIASAGTTLGEIQHVLDSAEQWLPIDPPRAPESTVGGVVAVGQSGPLRTRYGLPRDFVLGMTLMRPDGELVRAGGRVVKNVTGYDLMRLWTGSLGTLGIITEVAFKVLPKPETVNLGYDFPDYASLFAAANTLLANDVRPYILDALLVHEGRWSTFIRIDAASEKTVRDLLGHGGIKSSDSDSYPMLRDFGAWQEPPLSLRISSVPSKLETVIGRLRSLQDTVTMVARPLAGQARACWMTAPSRAAFQLVLDGLRAAVRTEGGSVVIERMPDDYRASVDCWGPLNDPAGLMRRVKNEFDPRGRLNAGRFTGGL